MEAALIAEIDLEESKSVLAFKFGTDYFFYKIFCNYTPDIDSAFLVEGTIFLVFFFEEADAGNLSGFKVSKLRFKLLDMVSMIKFVGRVLNFSLAS